MTTAAQTLRDAIEAWQRDVAQHRLDRFRAEPDAGTRSDVVQRHLWLTGQGGQEALDEALGDRQLTADQQVALARWIEVARFERAWLPLSQQAQPALVVAQGRQLSLASAWDELVRCDDRRQRSELARAIEGWMQQHWRRWIEARAEASERSRMQVGAVADDAQRTDALQSAASQFLRDTDDLARDQTRYLTRLDEPTWHDVMHALRARELDGFVKPASRLRRLAQPLHALGFERDLASRVRAESMDVGVLPHGRLALLQVPQQVHLGVSVREWGVISEYSTFGVLAGALAHALVSPALPVELRRSRSASIPRTWSSLFAGLLGERRWAARWLETSPRDAERIARVASVTTLLDVRRSAALLSLDAVSFSERHGGGDVARAAAACDVPLALWAGRVPSSATLLDALEAKLLGLALAPALRERYDEDWHRNPRVAEPLRGAAARGAELTAQAWGNELAADLSHASQCLLERLA